MDDDLTARLGLPFLAAGQMQKHVTLNEALVVLDGLVQASVASRSVTVQPDDPAEGEAYILPETATGAAWAAHDANDLLTVDAGGWRRLSVPVGALVFVRDEDQVVVRTGDGWAALGARLHRIEGLEGLALGAGPDPASPFLARLNAALWTAREAGDGGTGDLRITLNKTASGGVGSLILQTGFSGRAELGLVGDDDLTVKVSADGSVWREALRIEAATGRLLAPLGAVRRETTTFTADGIWGVPAWARSVTAVLVGGGGGGGAGETGAAGMVLAGGGGGGAGGWTVARWPAAALSTNLEVEVGAGGTGGVAGPGGDGGMTTVALGGQVLARAGGGSGGALSGGACGLGDAPGGVGGSGAAGLAGAGAEPGLAGRGPGAGGGGGGLTSGGAAQNGGSGGDGARTGCSAAGGPGGSGAGPSGMAAVLPVLDPVGGGGAGGAAGQPGGDGGNRGGGGGGGGASTSTPGSGGHGAPGVVVLIAEG
jgi:hypothetical protein